MRCAFLVGGLILVLSANGQGATNRFLFDDYLLVPVRVHFLSAKDSPAIHTTLTEKDFARILGKMNGVWAQAGLHFYVESLVHEEAEHQEDYAEVGSQGDRVGLLRLRPAESRKGQLFHVYYLKELAMNGIYFPEAIFVKDTASLRKVEGGIDEPLPRVTSHELGHAVGLSHRQNTTNLMASGTTGIWLNEDEISRAREAARKLDWVEPAPRLMKAADALFRAKKKKEAAELYSRLVTIPLQVEEVKRAIKRSR